MVCSGLSWDSEGYIVSSNGNDLRSGIDSPDAKPKRRTPCPMHSTKYNSPRNQVGLL